jgi:hypothetical protein
VFDFAQFAFHCQFINNPAYNRQRGPVSNFTLQLHLKVLTARLFGIKRADTSA